MLCKDRPGLFLTPPPKKLYSDSTVIVPGSAISQLIFINTRFVRKRWACVYRAIFFIFSFFFVIYAIGGVECDGAECEAAYSADVFLNACGPMAREISSNVQIRITCNFTSLVFRTLEEKWHEVGVPAFSLSFGLHIQIRSL